MKKRVSIYLKTGDNAAVTYYRFSQYFRTIDVVANYRLMIPDERQNDFLPIAKQPFWKKIIIFVYIYCRVLRQLIGDYTHTPDVLIISRRILDRVYPYHFHILLKAIKKKGCRIIWDFDDEIICLGEVSRRAFDMLSCLSDTIIVGSPFLKDLVREQYKDKVVYLPTTDGDMFHLIDEKVTMNRINSFDDTIKIVWVGTFSGLDHLIRVTPSLELYGEYLQAQGKTLSVNVVCDYPLIYNPVFFELMNVKWSRKISIEKMLEAHIGIMPLEDTEIARGKCGFKLIQYLSAGLPVVGSAVGINEIIINSYTGYCIKGFDENLWFDAFKRITADKSIWKNYSEGSQHEWEENHSYYNNLKQWEKILAV